MAAAVCECCRCRTKDEEVFSLRVVNGAMEVLCSRECADEHAAKTCGCFDDETTKPVVSEVKRMTDEEYATWCRSGVSYEDRRRIMLNARTKLTPEIVAKRDATTSRRSTEMWARWREEKLTSRSKT